MKPRMKLLGSMSFLGAYLGQAQLLIVWDILGSSRTVRDAKRVSHENMISFGFFSEKAFGDVLPGFGVVYFLGGFCGVMGGQFVGLGPLGGVEVGEGIEVEGCVCAGEVDSKDAGQGRREGIGGVGSLTMVAERILDGPDEDDTERASPGVVSRKGGSGVMIACDGDEEAFAVLGKFGEVLRYERFGLGTGARRIIQVPR
jgi:hypothetical protein